tara:strand:+ start:634 stop:1440 length:807 start_codon:yes stop_codon:yes gene_type:complete
MIGLGMGMAKLSDGCDQAPDLNSAQGKSARFNNSTGAYISLNDEEEFSFNEEGETFAVSTWIKRNQLGSDAWFAKGHTGGTLEYRVFFLGTGGLYVDFLDGSSAASSNYRRVVYNRPEINDAALGWKHYAISFNGRNQGTTLSETVTLWVDGVIVQPTSVQGSDDDGMSDLGGQFRIGAMDLTAYHLSGFMAQFIMWSDYELTQSDVDYFYENSNGTQSPLVDNACDYNGSDKVLAYMTLDGEADDLSVNEWEFVAQGGVSFVTDTPS